MRIIKTNQHVVFVPCQKQPSPRVQAAETAETAEGAEARHEGRCQDKPKHGRLPSAVR